MKYAVVLTEEPKATPGAMAQALAPVSGRPAADLAGPLKRARGLIELDADEAGAKRMAEALTAAGAPAMALPLSLVEDAALPQPLKALEKGDRSYVLLCAAAYRVASTKVVAGVPNPAKRALQLGMAAAGMPLGLIGAGKAPPQKVISEADLELVLDLYPAGGGRLRVRADDFDYSCLGTRKGYDAPGNFKRLLETLAPRAALLNSGARGLLEGKPVRELGYESAEDLDREGRWLVTLRAIGKL